VGIFDFFAGKGPEQALKLKSKVVQKYGDPTARQKAIDQLGAMDFPEAVQTLLARFTITVEPLTTDQDEKDHAFALLTAKGEKALEPTFEFLKRSDQASSWALRLLSEIAPAPEVLKRCLDYTEQLSSQYTRDPEKKLVLLQFLEGKSDERIGAVVVPFLEDMADDVKLAALKVLGPLKYEPARERILGLLTDGETARRVQTAALAALAESGFGVQGFREKVEGLLQDPYFVDKSGLLKKRGEASP
jgi:HEAT repeat protein